jgi:hypothetical protein
MTLSRSTGRAMQSGPHDRTGPSQGSIFGIVVH